MRLFEVYADSIGSLQEDLVLDDLLLADYGLCSFTGVFSVANLESRANPVEDARASFWNAHFQRAKGDNGGTRNFDSARMA
jgi:hypothetical protein